MPRRQADKMIKMSCPFIVRPTREEKRANYGQLPRPQSEDQTHQSLRLMDKMSYSRSMMFLDSGVDDPKIRCQPNDAELP